MPESKIPSTFIGGGSQPPLPESPRNRLDSLLYRASVVTSEAPKASAFAEKPNEPGDVESFLANNTGLFLMCEASWSNAQHKIDGLNAVTESGMHLFGMSDGNVIVRIDGGTDTGKVKRSAQAISAIYTQSVISNARREINAEKIEETTDVLQADLEGQTPTTLDTLANELMADSRPQRNSIITYENVNHREQIINAVGEIQDSYLMAFSFQNLAMRRITKLLETDENVEPFVKRLETILELRRHGIDEFPGMLEVLNVMIQQQQIVESASSLEKAMQRIAPKVYSLADFTKRMFAQEKPEIEGQAPAGFRNVVTGAQLVAQAIELDDSSGTKDIPEIIARHIPALTSGAVWTSAHEADATSRARADWRRLQRDIQAYECRGRVPDIVVDRGGPSISHRNARHRPARRIVKPHNTDDLQHLIAEDTSQLPVLGIMRQMGTKRAHTFVEFKEIDELLGHNIVTKFLAEHPEAPDLGTAVRKFTGDLVRMPTYPPVSEALGAKRFSIVAEGFPTQSFPLRRFKPNANSLQGLPQHTLHERVRIIFGLVPGRQKSYLLVKAVTLRERDTYNRL